MIMESSALVLLSGGMDSTTLLYYTIKIIGYSKVEAILFDYGQSHIIELKYAQKVARKLKVPYKVVKVDLRQFGGSSLTSDNNELSVVVPGRNAIFLSLAAAYAEIRGLQDIFFAPSLEDFKDFPDCREEFIQAIGKAVAIGYRIVKGIYAPFTQMSKREIVDMGRRMGVPYEDTWSCYFPIEKDEQYEPCGKCPACIERNKVL